MNTTKWFLIWVLVVFLAACTAQPTPTPVTRGAPSPTTVVIATDAATTEVATATPSLPTEVEKFMELATETPPDPTPVTLQTNVGELVFVSARFVDQVNGAISLPGCRILLVIVERLDKSRINLASFGGEGMNVFILGDDGSKHSAVMAGWVGNEFAIGIQVPNTAKTYTLAWGTNPPVDITAAVK